LVVDSGLNTQMTPNPREPIKLSHRLVLDYYTAKRLLAVLHSAVQQHESIYGVLEIHLKSECVNSVREIAFTGSTGPVESDRDQHCPRQTRGRGEIARTRKR
jgi:hypothetical protein